MENKNQNQTENQFSQNNWLPPPPPQEESMFSASTREFYAAEIRKSANKALIFGILSIMCCPPIFAYLGYTTSQEALVNIDIYEVEQNKKGILQAAKVLSIIGIVLWVIGVVLRIIGAAR